MALAFDGLIGNEQNKELLLNIVRSNNVLHSYMFVGESGIREVSVCKRICKNDFVSE